MADKKISELDQTLLLDNDADFPLSQDNAGEPTTFRAKLTQIATKIAEDMTFSNLQTTSKKLVGAINELLSLGSPIIIGTTAPTSSQGADGNIYIQYTAGTGGADDEVDGIFVKINGAWCEIQTGGGSGTTNYEDLSNKPQVNYVELVGNKSLDDLGIMPASLSKTVSGSIAHITDGADNIPVKSLTSEILAVESGNGQPKSPSNPYTISGHTEANVVVRASKNFFDKTTVTNGYRIGADGYPFPQTDYSISDWIETVPNIPIVANVTFSAYDGLAFYDNSKTFISRITSGTTVRVPTNAKYIRVAVNNSYLNTYQLQYGTTSTNYEAYSNKINTYTFAFGQTVYGGHFDNKGNLVVTHGIISDLGSLAWGGSDGQFNYSFNVIPKNWNRNSETWGKCSALKVESWSSVDFGTQSNNSIHGLAFNTYFILRVYASDYSTAEELKTALSGQSLIYELATPITLAITSQNIPTLLGENNIFSNCGDVEVEYYTDNADEIADVAKATASTPLHNYSTDEQVVGTWIDGSTIYERVFDLGSDVSIANDTLTDTTIDASNMNKIIYSAGQYSTGVTLYPLMANINNNIIRLQSDRNGNVGASVRYVILQYTKSV